MKPLQKAVFSWRAAMLPTLTIMLLVTLKGFATPMYATPMGRFPAMMIEVMASRSLLFGWLPAGYYEALLGPGRPDWERMAGSKYIPDAFRLRRLMPDLASVTIWPATKSPTNRFGYVGPDWTFNKPPRTRRIAILGDSIAQGLGVDSDRSFVTLLTNQLNKTGSPDRSRFEFLNFAVPGYQLTQMMDVALQDVPQFQPDVYVLMLTELSVHRSWDEHLTYLVESGADLKYDFLRATVREADTRQTDDDATLNAKFAPYRMPIIRQTISTMKANAERHNAQFIVVLVPAVEDADIARRRFAGIPELLSSMNIAYLDLSDAFGRMLDRNSIRLNRTDVHPNAKGDEMIYESLYKKLRANPDAWSKLVGPGYRENNQAGLSQ